MGGEPLARRTRRHLLLLAAGAALGAGVGWFLERVGIRPSAPSLVRPPGALFEDEFLATCIRCGQCTVACPFGTLHLADLGAGLAGGTPTFQARDTPCHLCEGYEEAQCIPACPTGALVRLGDFREARMGTAEIREDLCLPYQGRPCEICWKACPFPHHVIEFDTKRRPLVNEDCCIGCGLCEHACPTDQPAIVVRPWKGVPFG